MIHEVNQTLPGTSGEIVGKKTKPVLKAVWVVSY